MIRSAFQPRSPGRPDARRTAYVVPHTHWDREWYLPFESFRVRLVDVIDRLLDVMMSDAEYRVFTLDGQTIVLDDYLEVRPDREGTLRSLTEAKRIRIGPWHVLADEFLVSPEALIRNLAQGARICASFGDRLDVMYTPDSFGHVSQLPLLAEGFGLDAIVFERGVGDEAGAEGRPLRAEFLWRTADGASEVFTHHLTTTYSSAAAIGHADWEMRDAYDPDRAARHARAALFGHDGVDLSYLPPWFRASLERVSRGATGHATGDALLLLNGSDHLYAQPNIPQLIRDLAQRIPEVRFVHADLRAFVDHARASAGALQTHRGELRGSRYQHVLSGVLSARMYLKQANDAAQTRLEKVTEPLAALAWLEGAPYPRPLLHHAWSTLLQNHPHDSICGCSVDAVHDAMMTRFASVHHIAEPLEQRALERLAGGAGPEAVVVFHPHPFAATRVVEATLTLPGTSREPLELVGPDGRSVPADVRLEDDVAPGHSRVRVTRAHVRFEADLPALGIVAYRVLHGGDRNVGGMGAAGASATSGAVATGGATAASSVGDATAAGTTTERATTTAGAAGAAAIENDTLRLDASPEGGLTLTHAPSGARWPLELRFEDDADAGDTYDFSPIDAPPVVIRAPREGPQRIEHGPLRSTLRLGYLAEVPARLAADRRAREGAAALPITLDLTLEAGRPSLGVRVQVENRAEDHRLRLRLATGRDVDHVYAEGHFDILRRPVAHPGGADWFQAARGTNHQRRFVAVHDGARGLAILNRGLPEYEAIAGDRGVDVAVTLLRCVGWLSRDDLDSRPQGAGPALPTPGAQCPGRHVFELAVLPLVDADPWPALLREADLFSAPPVVRTVGAAAPGGTEELDPSAPPGSAASASGIAGARSSHAATGPRIELSPPLVMTALKVADTRDSLLVRIWNPSTRSVEGTLALGFAPAEAHVVRFDETRLHRIDVVGRTVRLALPSQGVRTVELVQPSKGVVAADGPD